MKYIADDQTPTEADVKEARYRIRKNGWEVYATTGGGMKKLGIALLIIVIILAVAYFVALSRF